MDCLVRVIGKAVSEILHSLTDLMENQTSRHTRLIHN